MGFCMADMESFELSSSEGVIDFTITAFLSLAFLSLGLCPVPLRASICWGERLKCVIDGVKEETPMQYFWHSNWIIHKQCVWKAGSYPEEGFSILLSFLLHINSYTPENSSNSVSPGNKRKWIYLQWLSEQHIGVAEAQLPSSLSLLERMCVFKCE